MFDFAAGGDFTKGLYFREGYVEYGTMEGYTLELTAGKKYNVRFNTAAWKSNGTSTRFRIVDEFGEAVLTQIVKNTPDVNGSTGAVSGSTYTEIKFIPENDGFYTLRWESAGDETSDPGYMEILLANVGVKYTPNQVGLEETLMLQTALENAKSTRDGNADERYAGEAYQALVDAIAKYEAEMGGYTAPSAYTKAAEELNALSQALKDHRQLCDNYDAQIKKAIDVVRQNRENKFAATTLYADVCDVVAKYHGTSEWVDVADHSGEEEGGDPVDPVWQLNYDFDKLTIDTELTAAIDELAKVVNVASLLFTEGESAPENAHNGKATGVAVLVDRLRLGAESLKALGVDENNDLITAANNALFDDDELADKIKREITIIVYGNLKDANNTMFEPIIDDETLEQTMPTYDVTVFAKNHNTYKLLPNMDFTPDNVPAWTTPEGFPKPGLTVGWGAPKHVEGVAEDCMFQTYKSPYRVEQTITDLPAGTYSIKYGFSERWDGDEGTMEGSFAYAKTSDTPEVEEGFEEDREYNFAGTADVVGAGQAFSFAVYGPGVQVDDIVVTDGVLTIGVNGGQTSGTFFNDIRILLTGPAPGFDYGTAYTEGIDSEMAAKVTVRSYEVYDLNGRRLAKAQRGIQIMKKHMSDGTTRIEKVVVK